MLRGIWRRLVRFLRRLLGIRGDNAVKIERLSDREYEQLFANLLTGVSQNWNQSQILQHLGDRVNDRFFKNWLREYGRKLRQLPDADHQLAWRMVNLSRVGCGEVGEIAADIGRDLLAKPVGKSGQDAKSIREDTNRRGAEEAEEREDRENIFNLESQDAEVWFDRGNDQYRAGNLIGAIASYDRAIEFKPDLHQAWLNRGSALENLGRFEDAIASSNRAIEIKPDFHEAWFNRGITLENLGRFEEAIAFYDRAIEFKPDFHEAWFNRGIALGNLGRFEDAIASFDKAIEVKHDIHDTWINRGVAAGNSRNYNPQAAMILQMQFPASPSVMLNPILARRGYEGELLSYQEGLKYCHEDTHPEGWGRLHQRIGDAHYFEGEGKSNYRGYWDKAVVEYKQALITLTAEDFPELHLDVLQDLIKPLLGLGQTTEADELRRRGTDLLRRLLNEKNRSEDSKKQLALKFAGFQQLTVDIAVQSGQLLQAIELAEEGKNSCLSWLLSAWGDEIPKPNYSDIKQLANSTTAIVYWHISPVALTTFLIASDAEEPLPIPARNGEGEESFQLTAASGELRGVKQLAEFEKWVKDWNADYTAYRKSEYKQGEATNNWQDKLPAAINRLGKILDIPAILSALSARNSISNLILIPHRDLHRFPLHTLFPDNLTITYLPSAQMGINLQLSSSSPVAGAIYEFPLLSVEHPKSENKDGEKLLPLPFAEIESEIICRMFSNTTRIAATEATKSKLQDALQQSHQIFHFTGHGSYNFNNPKLSALALSGKDRLAIEEILPLAFPDSSYQLVSLSACETAISGNQSITTEYVGLVSGFLRWGVAHVVTTLWTVESAASALVMMQFYRLLATNPPAEALAQALRWLRDLTVEDLTKFYQAEREKLPDDEGTIRPFLRRELKQLDRMEPGEKLYDHPYYWAAFTITGKIPEL
ncbi:CHAT domain-containing protein [Microcoleus sp. FACHB-831]|uniref:CHAT domain-containing protein n=1 Tax=Microcoleus sp. FACHB-831 TaxID=2692827 RepID=UPI001686F190|nr:CHAT domain-containing protein [Microcoleus sp. FACHB-831]MBD1920115.1 CHAT domain-containing protein [Microcoleus sp. FACHB-831]